MLEFGERFLGGVRVVEVNAAVLTPAMIFAWAVTSLSIACLNDPISTVTNTAQVKSMAVVLVIMAMTTSF